MVNFRLFFLMVFLATGSFSQAEENPYLNCKSSDKNNTYLFELIAEQSSRSVDKGGWVRDTRTVEYSDGHAKLTIQSKLSRGHVYEHMYLGEVKVVKKERLIQRHKKPTYLVRASAIPLSWNPQLGVVTDQHPSRSGALSLSMTETVYSEQEARQLMNGNKKFRKYFAHRIVEDRHSYPVRLDWDCKLTGFKWD